MKISGIMASDPFAQRFLNGYINPDAVKDFRDIPASITVKFAEAHMMQKGSEENFRPYLLLIGQVQSVSFGKDVQTPYGIEGVTFGRQAPDIIYRYEFNDEALKQLVDMSFFSQHPPEVPAIFTNAPFEDLPMQVKRLSVIAPDPHMKYNSENPPLVIVDMGDLTDCKTNLAESGYGLAEYFQPSPFTKSAPSTGYGYDDTKDFEDEVTPQEPEAESEALYNDLDVEEDAPFEGEEEMLIPEEEPEVEIPETEEEIEARLGDAVAEQRPLEIQQDPDDIPDTEEELAEPAAREKARADERRRMQAARDKLADDGGYHQYDAAPDISDNEYES